MREEMTEGEQEKEGRRGLAGGSWHSNKSDFSQRNIVCELDFSIHSAGMRRKQVESGRHFAAVRVCRRSFCPLLLFLLYDSYENPLTSLSACETALARATRILNTATCTVISRVTCRDCVGFCTRAIQRLDDDMQMHKTRRIPETHPSTRPENHIRVTMRSSRTIATKLQRRRHALHTNRRSVTHVSLRESPPKRLTASVCVGIIIPPSFPTEQQLHMKRDDAISAAHFLNAIFTSPQCSEFIKKWVNQLGIYLARS